MINKRIVTILVLVGLILLVPLVAMQFTDQVDWSRVDFVIAGILLFTAGLIYELLTRGRKLKQRIIITIIVLIVFVLIWAELAVGLVGTPWAGS